MTIRQAIALGSAELKAAGIENPSLDANILLANALTRRDTEGAGNAEVFNEFTRTELIVIGGKTLPEETLSSFRALIERRKNGECVAYITGKKEFYGLEFYVNNSVLVPRPETEILVEKAIEIGIRKNKKEKIKMKKEHIIRVLDLCTGSGAVAIALKKEIPEIEVIATDISGEALEVAKTNAQHLLHNDNNITFQLGDLFEALLTVHCSLFTVHSSYLFSLIVSNPPYIPTAEIDSLSPEVQNEPRIALDGGENGLSLIERIIYGAPDYLQRGGHLLLEADPRQMQKITFLLEKRGFGNIIKYKDLAGLERVIGGRYT